MTIGNRAWDRFWILLTVRIAFGFMFLISAMNIFFYEWDEKKTKLENFSNNLETVFVEGLSKPFGDSWINLKIPYGKPDPATGARKVADLGLMVVKAFLRAMPFIMAVLSILLLTGLFVRPALRASAIFLVLLGLGKYLTDFKSGSTITTLQDFMYAMFITIALYTTSKEPEEAEPGVA